MKSRKAKAKTRKARDRGRRRRYGQNKTHSSAAPRLRIALLLAKAGAPVVPLHGLKDGCCPCGDAHCERPRKHPRTKLDIADATLDSEEIRPWWQKWPKAKIGIVMGWPGNLVALATDGQAGRRSVFTVTRKPDGPDRASLCSRNLASEGHAIAFRVEQRLTTGDILAPCVAFVSPLEAI
jgi:hypothetical protein